MRVIDLPLELLDARLRGEGLRLAMPPFTACIRTELPALAPQIAGMYGDFELLDEGAFCDFHVALLRGRGLRRWLRPQAEFAVDGRRSFVPLPAAQGLAMLEWGLNWCVAAHGHQYLLIHAAVLERHGRALLMPAPPGSGKSTLCAALLHRGWRLLSDELALLDPDTGLLHGMARPVNLKNGSIELIRRFEPAARLSAPMPNTSKGEVALMRPPAAAVLRAREPARPAWIVLPRWRPGTQAARFTPLEKAACFMAVAGESFNYDIHGLRGFEAMGRLVDSCRTLAFEYEQLDQAADCFAALAEQEAP
ncbi:HprK-related kinase A [Pelomonas sp. KK5]|uniref:HprK-related kinase A n=1 Tax=Pelomonas sp. KK5 TaxID=1855730 RepID=UPI00097C90AA|nr:HprK-related kinase A [Pelomonas sp. KK5]